MDANTILEVDLTVLAFGAGTVIPLLTAVVTKMNSSSGVKATANLVLSVIAGGVAHLVTNEGSSTILELITAMAMVYLGSGVSYQNFWKPTGTSLAVQRKTAAIGVGGTHVQVAPDTDQA